MHRASKLNSGAQTEAKRALSFAGKILIVIVAFVGTLLIIRASFALSKWAGFSSLVIVLAALYATAHRWVVWLPGILVFGVINSLIALVTRHSPANATITISTELAVLLLSFYTIGVVIAYWYRTSQMSIVDRLAWVLYVVFMVLPAFTRDGKLGVVTPTLALMTISGLAPIIVAFVIQQIQARKWSGEPE